MIKKTYRKFLNKDQSLTAFVAWEICDNWAGLSISDCNRMISLDFNTDSEKGRKEAEHKVAGLRSALDKFEAELSKRIAKERGKS